MKRLITILLLLQANFAQSQTTATCTSSKQLQPYSKIAAHQLSSHQRHNTGRTMADNDSRCIAIVNYDSIGIPTDSSIYNYTGNRGSHTNGNPWEYDSAYDYTYSSGIYSNYGFTTQLFDANNNIIYSLMQTWNTATGSWQNNTQYYCTYDSHNNKLVDSELLWSATSGVWQNSTLDYYTYNSSNQLIRDSELYGSGSLWVNYGDTYVDYSGAELTAAYLLNWNTGSSSWDSNYIKYFFYNSSGYQTAMYELNYNSGTRTWDSMYNIFNYYNSMNLDTETVEQNWEASTSTWLNYFYLQSNFSGNNYQYVLILNGGNTIATSDTIGETFYIYNSYGQFLYSYNENYIGGGQFKSTEFNDATRWYYELYTNAVPQITQHGENVLQVFPNPNSGQFSINISCKTTLPIPVTITNMLGQTISEVNIPANQVTQLQLQAPPGIYLVIAQTASGKIMEKVVVE